MIQLTPKMFLIICPMLFLTGLVDSIGGGGGLISLPAYLFAGLPVHAAIATNKLSSACGTALTTIRFIRNGMVNILIAVPSVICAFAGSTMGAWASLRMSEKALKYILFAVLPIAAFFVLNRQLFSDKDSGEVKADGRTVAVAMVSALIIGFYDGFYGPGTGTFLIIAFTVFAGMGAAGANAHAKVINLTTNLSSLFVFWRSGQVIFPLGIAGAVCCMAGNYVGSGLVLTKGSKIVRPVILAVLAMLLVKIITDL